MKIIILMLLTFLSINSSANLNSGLWPNVKYLCTSEFDPAMRLIAEVESKQQMLFTVISDELYRNQGGASMQLTASRKQDNPHSKDAIFSAGDVLYDYYLPFPKSEIEKPTVNYFFPTLTIKVLGTFDTRTASLTCAQQF